MAEAPGAIQVVKLARGVRVDVVILGNVIGRDHCPSLASANAWAQRISETLRLPIVGASR